jgi:two-component system, cell cycle sensor histidine kinase and response regulator CckA
MEGIGDPPHEVPMPLSATWTDPSLPSPHCLLRLASEFTMDAQPNSISPEQDPLLDVGEWQWTPQSGQVELNAAARRLFTVEDQETASVDLSRLLASISPLDRKRLDDGLQLAHRTSGRLSLDVRHVDQERGVRWIHIRGRAPESGAPGSVHGIALDVTETHVREEQFHQTRRVEAMGRLAGGIAHEFHTLLTMVMGSCEVAQQLLPLGHPVGDCIQQIKQASSHATTLTSQLLAFDRSHHRPGTPIDPDARIQGQASELRHALGQRITLELSLAAPAARIVADPALFDHIIHHLVMNARDAMPGEGTVTVTSSTTDHELMIRIIDTGLGIPPEVVDRIFEPFFTTKPEGRAIGLGLAASQNLILRWGGRILVESSSQGQGTAFTIALPLCQTQLSRSEGPTTTTSIRRSSRCILVAEDDPGVRELITSFLRHQGYRILEAEDGDEAVRLAEEHEYRFDLLLSDVVLPRRPGPALADHLRRFKPDLQVILMSGFTNDQALTERVGQAGFTFLQKPFTPLALAKIIGERLGVDPTSAQG